MGEPVAGPVLVDHDRRRIGLRVVVTDGLDDPAVPRGTAVGDDDAPDRVLARPDPRESDSYGHVRRLRLAAPPILTACPSGAAGGRASCRSPAGPSSSASARTA